MEVTFETEHRRVAVVEESQPSAARAAARDAARACGLDETDAYRAGIVATELATNLAKYATGGELLVRALADATVPAVELVSIDRGPGMSNVDEALRDGHSTGGSQGTGLGAVRRLAEEFDIHSVPSKGTVVFARVNAGRARRARAAFEAGGISVACSSDEPCGDSWAVRHDARSLTALVVDGLGHGLFAAEAARAAVSAWRPERRLSVATALAEIHDGIRHTRGAAGALAEIDAEARLVRFAGVGNIAGAILADAAWRQAVSHNGTLGHEARHFREFAYPWHAGALLVMNSDGLVSHWSLDAYPGLARRHPSIVAAVLYRDFSRGRDDVTILVCRQAAAV